MSVREGILDWAWKVVNLVGLPGVVTWALYDRRKIQNQARKDEIDIQADEANLPNRVRTSSVVSLEAELIALSRTFEMDRDAKERTIKWLTEQNRALRKDIEERDQMIDQLQDTVDGLKNKIREVTDNLDQVQRDLAKLRASSDQHNSRTNGHH